MLQGPNPLWLLLEIIYFRMGIHQKKKYDLDIIKNVGEGNHLQSPKGIWGLLGQGIGDLD